MSKGIGMEEQANESVLKDIDDMHNEYSYESIIESKVTVFQMYFSDLVVYCKRVGTYFVNDTEFFNTLFGMKKKLNKIFDKLINNKRRSIDDLLKEVYDDCDKLILRLNAIDDKYLRASRQDTLFHLLKLKTLLYMFSI